MNCTEDALSRIHTQIQIYPVAGVLCQQRTAGGWAPLSSVTDWSSANADADTPHSWRFTSINSCFQMSRVNHIYLHWQAARLILLNHIHIEHAQRGTANILKIEGTIEPQGCINQHSALKALSSGSSLALTIKRISQEQNHRFTRTFMSFFALCHSFHDN